jgi:hypothetical protein
MRYDRGHPMTFTVDIMLRADHRVFEEPLEHPRPAAEWTDTDVADLLRDVLRAIARVQSGDTPAEPRSVSFEGLSWIVSPYRGAVVIALEIHSASAVAGPFDLDAEALDAMLARVVRGESSPATVH